MSDSPLQSPLNSAGGFDKLTAGGLDKPTAGDLRAGEGSPVGSASPGLDYAAGERRARPGDQGPATWGAAARGLLRQPRFILAAGFLLISAVGLNAATTFLKLHFRKLAVPLPVKSLSDETEGIPAHFGHWVQVRPDEPLNPDVEGALGTSQYVENRVYVDTRLDSRMENLLHNPSKSERDERLQEFVNRHSKDAKGDPLVPALTVGITYYTGMVDTVAHIPERCYIANGYEQVSKEVDPMPAGFADGKPRDVKFTFINFDDQTNQEHGVFVAYFFQVNGKYTEDPIEVRKTLQDLTEKYGYYAKVEIKAATSEKRDVTPEYKAKVETAIKDFIAAALPEIEKRLPDWQRVKAGGG